MTTPPAPDLPSAAEDHGDRVDLRAPATTRVVSLAGGGLAVALGLITAVFGPEGMAAHPGILIGFGSALVIAGAASMLQARRRLTVGPSGISRRGAWATDTAAWSDIDRLEISEERDSDARAAGSSWRFGPLRLRSGAGPRRPRGGVGVGAGSRPTSAVTAHRRGGGSALQARVDGVRSDDTTAVLGVASERGWLPDGLDVRRDDPQGVRFDR